MENGRKNARGKAYLDNLTVLRYSSSKWSDSGRKSGSMFHVKDYPLCPNGLEIYYKRYFFGVHFLCKVDGENVICFKVYQREANLWIR